MIKPVSVVQKEKLQKFEAQYKDRLTVNRNKKFKM